MMNLWLGHVQINHVNSREVRLRAHHHQGSRGMLVRPGSAVFDPNSTSSGIYLVKFYPLYDLNFNFKCQINMLLIYFQLRHQQLVQQGEAQLLLQLLPVDMNKLGGKLSFSRWKTLRKIPPTTKIQFLRTLWQKKEEVRPGFWLC